MRPWLCSNDHPREAGGTSVTHIANAHRTTIARPTKLPTFLLYSTVPVAQSAAVSLNLGCILTSASVNDCQVAIPLATMTAARVTNLYDLMDAAYDAAEIRAHSESLGHVPIIDVNPRNSAALKRDLQQEAKARRTLGQMYAKGVRYRERSIDSRARQRSAEGRIRRPSGTRARAQQGTVPPDVRHPGVDRGSVAALRELNPTSFSPT